MEIRITNKNTMKTITLSGGFHSSPEIKLRVNDKAYARLKDAEYIKDELAEVLTPYQLNRLDKHFCGIDGCTCGSWMRAAVEL